MEKFLLPITFVFGVIYLLSLTKLFDTKLTFITLAFIPHNNGSVFESVLSFLGVWFFYFSLIYQSWYWLFR